MQAEPEFYRCLVSDAARRALRQIQEILADDTLSDETCFAKSKPPWVCRKVSASPAAADGMTSAELPSPKPGDPPPQLLGAVPPREVDGHFLYPLLSSYQRRRLK